MLVGPLDGVPIAVKEELDVIGYHTTMGTPFLGREVSHKDALAVDRLRKMGLSRYIYISLSLSLSLSLSVCVCVCVFI